METLAEIRVALHAASERVEQGSIRHAPQQFLDELWSTVYEAAPVDLQPYVWSRLVELGARLGLYAAPPAQPRPPDSHYRP